MSFLKTTTDHKVVPCVIANTPVPLPQTAEFPIIQASTNSTIHHAHSADVPTAKAACEAAASAFKIWSKTPPQARRDILNKFASILESRAADAENRKVSETSAPPMHAKFDVYLAHSIAREIAASLVQTCQGQIVANATADGTSFVFKEAYGPVLIIPPWNGAVILPVRGICSALAAGCTVVLKASEMCPWTHQIILECFQEAGLPAGALNQVQASRDQAAEVTEAIISHPAIRKVEFIGSAEVGKIVGQMAARYLKPTIMELGDQSPVIVCEDADLDKAAKAVAFASNILHGQICFATERILVHTSVYTPFVAALRKAFTMPIPTGSAVSRESFHKVQALLQDAISHGAEFVVGDAEPVGVNTLKPSILANVSPKSRISESELFGPVALMSVFESEAEAIELANSKSGGLSASVYTKDWERGLRMSRELEFGQVQVNAHTMYGGSTMPVTGWKGSGWGSNGGHYGIEEFLQNKTVALHSAASSGGLPF